MFGDFLTCLLYHIYYSFFESFPRVYSYTYHFTELKSSPFFLSITRGGFLDVLVYLL